MPEEAKTKVAAREEEENQRHPASKKRERAPGGASSGKGKQNLKHHSKAMRATRRHERCDLVF